MADPIRMVVMTPDVVRLRGRIANARTGPRGIGRSLLLAAIIMGLTGCAGFGAAPATPQYDTDATHALMAALQNANADLVSCKGLGKVSLTVDGARRTFDRAAWAVAEPGRMRFDARTPFGLPILSLACNEAYLTAMAHAEGRYYRKSIAEDHRLGMILPIDIACRDLSRLMIGRPPIVDYHSARLEETTADVQTILLRRRFRGTVAKLFLDASSGDLIGFELLNVHGKRRYRAQMEKRRTIKGFALPHHLRLESAKGQLALDMVRLYPNAPVSGSLFHIPPPH